MGAKNFDLFLVSVSVDQINLSKSPVSLCLGFYGDNRREATPILVSPLKHWAGDVHSVWVCMCVSACVCDDVCCGEFKKVRVVPKPMSLCDQLYDFYFAVV